MILGPTKAGKTTLIATAAEYIYETWGKILVLYTAELGGFSARVEQRVRQGLIRPVRMRTRDDEAGSLSFETLQLCSKGYMPVRFLNPFEGEMEQGVPMIGPTTTVHEQFCGGCGASVIRTRYKSKLKNTTCPACKKPVTLVTGTIVSTVQQTKGFENIGGLGFDGLTSFSDWYLQDMSHRTNLQGEMSALGGEIESGGITFRGNNRSQVGMAQTRVHELVANSLSIPNLELMPFWTAISHESSDDTGRLTIVGPKLAGDAKTYIACSWFGNVVEAEVRQTEHHEYTRRLWVSQFYDEQNRRHLCGHRGDPRFMNTYFEDQPYSDDKPPTQICTGFSLGYFFKQVEQSIQKGMEADKIGDGVVPGTDSIPSTYGDSDDELAPAPTAKPTAGPTAVARKPSAVKPRVPGSKPQVTKEEPAAVIEEPSPEVEQPELPAAEPTEEVPASEVTDVQEVAPADAPPVAEPDAEPVSPPVQQAAQSPAVPAAGGWARPAGTKPPAPRAPQPGPKAPARTAPRPVQGIKPS